MEMAVAAARAGGMGDDTMELSENGTVIGDGEGATAAAAAAGVVEVVAAPGAVALGEENMDNGLAVMEKASGAPLGDDGNEAADAVAPAAATANMLLPAVT